MVSMLSLMNVGSGVLLVFPDYEFGPHLHDSFPLLTSPSGLPKHNKSSFKPFLDPLNMKRLLNDLVAFHAR
jgi:hypothetical protein